jgi:hypothetical protein
MLLSKTATEKLAVLLLIGSITLNCIQFSAAHTASKLVKASTQQNMLLITGDLLAMGNTLEDLAATNGTDDGQSNAKFSSQWNGVFTCSKEG